MKCVECVGVWECEWCGQSSSALEEFVVEHKLVSLCPSCAKEQRQKEIDEMGELVEELY